VLAQEADLAGDGAVHVNAHNCNLQRADDFAIYLRCNYRRTGGGIVRNKSISRRTDVFKHAVTICIYLKHCIASRGSQKQAVILANRYAVAAVVFARDVGHVPDNLLHSRSVVCPVEGGHRERRRSRGRQWRIQRERPL